MAKPTVKDFKELGSRLGAGLSYEKMMRGLYNELKSLETTAGMEGITAGRRLLVQLYFPDRSDIFLAEIKVEEKLDSRTEKLEANIVMQNYLHKHDTRRTPAFFSTDDYLSAKEEGKLGTRFELFRVLGRTPRPMYYVHRDAGIAVTQAGLPA